MHWVNSNSENVSMFFKKLDFLWVFLLVSSACLTTIFVQNGAMLFFDEKKEIWSDILG